MIDRWPTPALLLAALAVSALLVGAFVDHAVTDNSLPEIDNFADAPQADLTEREDALDGFELRAWRYSLGIILAIGGLVAFALRPASPEQRPDIFRDLGVAGVLFLFAGFYIQSREPYLLADSSSEGVYILPGIAMLIAAGVGAFATRDRTERGGPKAELAAMPPVAIAAIGFAALTILLVAAGHSDRECGQSPSDLSDALLAAAVFVSIAAGVCGFVSLFKRRWFAALLSIPAPLLALASLVAAACLS